MALRTGQSVTDLIELMGLPRAWPEVFDEMVALLKEKDAAAAPYAPQAVDFEAKFAAIERRSKRGR